MLHKSEATLGRSFFSVENDTKHVLNYFYIFFEFSIEQIQDMLVSECLIHIGCLHSKSTYNSEPQISVI